MTREERQDSDLNRLMTNADANDAMQCESHVQKKLVMTERHARLRLDKIQGVSTNGRS